MHRIGVKYKFIKVNKKINNIIDMIYYSYFYQNHNFNIELKTIFMDNSLKSIIDNQKNYFSSKKTIDIESRIKSLKKLLKEIKINEKEIEYALFSDLGK